VDVTTALKRFHVTSLRHYVNTNVHSGEKTTAALAVPEDVATRTTTKMIATPSTPSQVTDAIETVEAIAMIAPTIATNPALHLGIVIGPRPELISW
jgi:hypothetical protein